MNIRLCKHCNLEFDIKQISNHSRWCKFNPKRKSYLDKLQETRLKVTPETKNKMRQGLIKAHKDGKYYNSDGIHINAINKNFKDKHHTEETKKKISEAGLNSTHRRLRKNPILYKNIILDSKWELALAIRLDELNIKWIRPEPIKWTDKTGVTHNYFADFYLVDYDLYLDPKNPHVINMQKEKLNYLQMHYNNIKIISTLEECENFIL